jgi:hypothetical protein
MKSKNISILLFILVFAGVALLGYTQVWAQCSTSPAENAICLGDGYCSALENQLNFCISLGDPSNPCYVVEALDCNGEWPCVETIGGDQYKAFRYRATANAPCNCPTWSYTVTQYQVCAGSNSVDYVMGSAPSGASLFKCKVAKCGDINPNAECFFEDSNEDGEVTCNEDFQNWKLNPTLNCSTGGSIDFTVYTPLGAGVSCGNPTYIRDNSGCQDTEFPCDENPTSPLNDVLLRGPGCGDAAISITSFIMGGFAADLDPCTGEVLAATIEGQPANEVLGFFCDPQEGNPLVPCNPIEDKGCICYQLTNSGNLTGCVMKGSTRGVVGSRVFTRP